MLIHNEDDIEFVTEFPCLLGHPLGELEFTDRKQKSTRIYRQKVGKLEFTDRNQENQSLKIESRKTRVYRQKVTELSLKIKEKHLN